MLNFRKKWPVHCIYTWIAIIENRKLWKLIQVRLKKLSDFFPLFYLFATM